MSLNCLGDLFLWRRSLFEKDKLLFSFSLAFKLKLDQGLISQQELRFLMTGKQCHWHHVAHHK